MNIYAAHGVRDFVVALGYRPDVVKEYLLNLRQLSSSFRLTTSTGQVDILDPGDAPDWRVAAVDTGELTETGGRILRASQYVAGDTFMVTYGDGVADVDVRALLAFHRSHGKLVTVTAVRPPARFGSLHLDGPQVLRFGEKSQSEEGWINGGFFVVERPALAFIKGDHAIWERTPLEQIASDGELMAYFHDGFWQPMDTLRERSVLEDLWRSGEAPWKVW